MSSIAELLANSPDREQLSDDLAVYACAFIDEHGRRLDPVITEAIPDGMRRRLRRPDEAHASVTPDTRPIIGSDE